MTRVLVAAGGTGGHVYPALAVAEVLRGRGHDVTFVGGDRIEARIVPAAGFELHRLPARSLPRRPSLDAIAAGVAFVRSMRGARQLLRATGADVVLGFGGYPSLAPSLAGGRAGRRVVLHEQNARVSLANRLSLRAASALALSLPLERSAPRRSPETVMTGNPIRDAVRSLAESDVDGRSERRLRALRRWGLDPGRVTLLAFGGSLGARALNDALPSAVTGEARDAVQVIHVAGPDLFEAARTAWRGTGVVCIVEPYLDDLEEGYAAADLVLARSGASTVAELTAIGLPSVLVPYPLAPGDAQGANARVVAGADAALLVSQTEPDLPGRLRAALGELVGDPTRRAGVASAARRLGRPDAAERLAELVLHDGG